MVSVIGAGLAGCEATYQLIKRGIQVRLFEMRPKVMTPAHHTGNFCELVCSNSFRSDSLKNASGLLKHELRGLDSLIMKFADQHKVPAGSALAVDRLAFSIAITDYLKQHPLVEFIEEEVTSLPEGPVIIATGPLTSDKLSQEIINICGRDNFSFFDASAPIISKTSLDFSKLYYKSRYDDESNDYLNAEMNFEEYNNFYKTLLESETVTLKEFENQKHFEGCLPIEVLAKRGFKSLLFGPLKPVGLKRKKDTVAVVQLRKENVFEDCYNLVGFQTNLTFKSQKSVIKLIPGLEKAEILRYGVMHRNSFIDSPHLLNKYYQLKSKENIFFAGQITGVEGYLESTASGLLAALNMLSFLKREAFYDYSNNSIITALASYVATPNPNFQPINANFGILFKPASINKSNREKFFLENSNTLIQELIELYGR